MRWSRVRVPPGSPFQYYDQACITAAEACRRPPCSAACKGQPERNHLLPVANQQNIAGKHGVVPGLALHRREPRDLGELAGDRRDKRKFTLLRQHQQQVLVSQQEQLAVAVTSALPLALAVLEVDASENAADEPETMSVVNDEVIEVGLQPDRRPTLLDGPSAGSSRNRETARAAAVADADQDVAVRGQGRLHD